MAALHTFVRSSQVLLTAEHVLAVLPQHLSWV